MNVFLRELTAYRQSTIIWTISMSTLIVIYMALYPAFTYDVAATKEVLASLPEAVRTAFNISLESFFTVYGFYGYILSFAILAGAIQAMNVGTGVISKEISGKTADFLLSKPITRSRMVSAKLAAALTVVLITDAVFTVVAYLTTAVVSEDPVDIQTFLLLTSTLLLVQLVFLALGALFSVTLPRIKSVVSVSLPTVFAFYIIGMIGDVLESEQVRYLSPFRYFDTIYIISNVSLEGRYLAIVAGFVVVTVAVSYLVFIKKNFRASA